MKFLAAVFCMVFIHMLCFSLETPKLTLTYRVDQQSYVIKGFENRNPYYLIHQEKVFPKSGGYWKLDGKFDELKKFGYLPNLFRLNLDTLSFKYRDEPKLYFSQWTERHDEYEIIPVEPTDESYIYFDQSEFSDLIVVATWIASRVSLPRVVYLNKDSVANFVTDDLRSLIVHEADTDGYPIIWFLNKDTM